MSDGLIRFGLFELDRAARLLSKQGRRVRLQEQPLRVLEFLLEHPGRLVTREELKQRLWPDDVYVDFELGLNAAVKRLRVALGDSGDNPRFIETVPRSGYRFLAPVRGPEEAATPSAPAPPSPLDSPQIAPPTAPSAVPARRAPRLWLAPLLTVAVVTGGFFLRPAGPALRVTRVVQLSTTGRAWPQEGLLSDGARLYYTSFTLAEGFRLRQILLNGNEDTPVAGLPPDTLIRSLSPDGTMFLAISATAARDDTPSSVWMVPVVGGPARRLGNIATNDIAWSPDGGTLAFAENHEVRTATLDGTDARTLATVDGRPFYLRWAPDGSRIRFSVQDRTGALATWEVESNGQHMHALSFNRSGGPMEGLGEWMPDSRRFVFTSRQGALSNIWVDEPADWMHRSASEPTQLTAGPISYSRVLPSRDGTRLFALGSQPAGELVRYAPGVSDATPFLGGPAADELDFSRDGHWVVYSSFPGADLWRARPDGSEPLQLTFPPVRAFAPRVSPDGRRIAFTMRKPGELPRIATMSIDGGNPEPVLVEPHAQATPSWCPDAACLVYGRDQDGDGQDIALFRRDFASRSTARVTNSDGLLSPVLSSDGRMVAAIDIKGHVPVVVDVASGQRRVVATRRGDYPAWSPDGRYVYFNTLMGADRAVFRLRVADGGEERVTSVPFPTSGVYGAWMGLAPDGALLFLRSRTLTDVYAMTLSQR